MFFQDIPRTRTNFQIKSDMHDDKCIKCAHWSYSAPLCGGGGSRWLVAASIRQAAAARARPSHRPAASVQAEDVVYSSTTTTESLCDQKIFFS